MKKIKFSNQKEEEEFNEIYDKELVIAANCDGDEGGENDLDLDTIKASRNRPKGLKDDNDFSEDEEVEVKWDLEERETETEGSDIELQDPATRDSSALDSAAETEIEIEPFNLKTDREEGTFDSEGFFIRNTDEDRDQDRWMSNLTPSDIAKAKAAHTRILLEQQQHKHKQEKFSGDSEKHLFSELFELIGNHFNVADAIRSFKSRKGPPLNKNRLKKLTAAMTAAATAQPSSATETEKQKLDRITEIADALMDRGYFGIYEMTKEELKKQVSK